MTLTFDLARSGGASDTSAAEFSEYNLTTTEEVVALNDDGITYTQVPNMVSGITTDGFSVVAGSVVYTGATGIFLINGTSDLEANKAFEVSYAMFVNDTLITTEITKHTFTASSNIENISITSMIMINTGDVLNIRAKSDGTATSIITIKKLDVTMVQL